AGAGTVDSVPSTGGPTTTIVTGLNQPYEIAVSGTTLYIADTSNNRIVTAPITGGHPTPFVTVLNQPAWIAVG
ncbi:MAG: hypothetical protein JST73_09190, partial [Actinobacteria bacterium]|nr:hypothetical protein [Actinomycetota bacterium]